MSQKDSQDILQLIASGPSSPGHNLNRASNLHFDLLSRVKFRARESIRIKYDVNITYTDTHI